MNCYNIRATTWEYVFPWKYRMLVIEFPQTMRDIPYYFIQSSLPYRQRQQYLVSLLGACV